jgi:hypothetical protein
MPGSNDNSKREHPFEWAMRELEKHFQADGMDIKLLLKSLRIDLNEYGNIELILEMSPEIAIIIGEALMNAGKRPDFMKELDDDPE